MKRAVPSQGKGLPDAPLPDPEVLARFRGITNSPDKVIATSKMATPPARPYRGTDVDPQDAHDDERVLEPLFADPALMALMWERYVPFAFVVKRLHSPPTTAKATKIASALLGLKVRASRSKSQRVALAVNFAIVNNVLNVGSGTLNAGQKNTVLLKTLPKALVDKAIKADNAEAHKEIAAIYAKLKKETDIYEQVLRRCERSLDLAEALQGFKVDKKPFLKQDFVKLKVAMNRYGLMQEPAFAERVKLEGPLAKEILQRYVGEHLDETVPRLLKRALAIDKREAPA